MPARAGRRPRIGRECCSACARWAERHGYGIDHMEESAGEEAGIKSAALRIAGANAYGWLKTESGVHRLVRISPFDSSARRHTSFTSVWVYPVINDEIEIAVEDKDLRIDTYRASGAGGQHVNKTDSAIRITHLPTGIVVQCQNDRSQHKNRASAMSMLKARLYEAELQKQEAESQAEHDAKTEIGWGVKSGPTFCSLTRWSRICARPWRHPIPPPFWTVIWTSSWRPLSPLASDTTRIGRTKSFRDRLSSGYWTMISLNKMLFIFMGFIMLSMMRNRSPRSSSVPSSQVFL